MKFQVGLVRGFHVSMRWVVTVRRKVVTYRIYLRLSDGDNDSSLPTYLVPTYLRYIGR